MFKTLWQKLKAKFRRPDEFDLVHGDIPHIPVTEVPEQRPNSRQYTKNRSKYRNRKGGER